MGTELSITAALQKSLSTTHAGVDRMEPISHAIIPSVLKHSISCSYRGALSLSNTVGLHCMLHPGLHTCSVASLSVQAVSSKAGNAGAV